MNLRALARASDDSVYTLSLLGFSSSSSSFSLSFFIPEEVGVSLFFISLSLSLSRARAMRDAWPPERRRDEAMIEKTCSWTYEFNSWLHTSSWASSWRSAVTVRFFFVSLSFLLGNIFCQQSFICRLRESRSGGVEVVFLRRWWFNNVLQCVRMISRRGVRVMWWLQNIIKRTLSRGTSNATLLRER